VAPRRLSSAVAFLALAGGLLVLAGCAQMMAPPRQSVPRDAKRAVELLAERWKQFTDVRTLADLELTRDGSKDRFRGVLLVKAPTSVRFEALSPFGQPFLFLVIHDGDLIVYNAATNEALLSPATAEATAKLLSLPFEPQDVVSILAGRPAPPADLRRAEIEDVGALGADDTRTGGVNPPGARPAEGRALVMVSSLHQQRVWMDFDTGVVSQVEITGGRYAVVVHYERAANGEVSSVSVSAPRAKLATSINYLNPEIGVGLEPDQFEFAVPRSASIERLR
jgi:outer membrane lipoprotein-sorting protein